MTADLSRRLDADLAQAGADAPARPAAPARLCPLALRYVLLGARLGVRAIARRRAAGPRIAYFEAVESFLALV